MRALQILIIVLSLLQSSCIHHRRYVPSSFEPFTLENKKEVEISGNARLFKYANLGLTVAVTDYLAVRATYGGFVNLNNYAAHLIFFKKLQ